MTVQDLEKPNTKKEFSLKRVIYGLLIFLILTVLVVVYFGENDTNTYTAQVPIPKQNEGLDDIGAYIEAKDYIEMILKAPATAIFPPLGQVNRLDNNRYEVVSYVDSQNSFGAMLRSGWKVIFQYQNGKKYLEKMVFDGEVVYPVEQSDAYKRNQKVQKESQKLIDQIDNELGKLKSMGY